MPNINITDTGHATVGAQPQQHPMPNQGNLNGRVAQEIDRKRANVNQAVTELKEKGGPSKKQLLLCALKVSGAALVILAAFSSILLAPVTGGVLSAVLIAGALGLSLVAAGALTVWAIKDYNNHQSATERKKNVENQLKDFDQTRKGWEADPLKDANVSLETEEQFLQYNELLNKNAELKRLEAKRESLPQEIGELEEIETAKKESEKSGGTEEEKQQRVADYDHIASRNLRWADDLESKRKELIEIPEQIEQCTKKVQELKEALLGQATAKDSTQEGSTQEGSAEKPQ